MTLGFVGILATASIAEASDWSDGASELIADQERRFETGLKTFAHYCGFSPEWSINWTSATANVENAAKEGSTAGFSTQCLQPLGELQKICGDGGAPRVADQITSYRCEFSAKKGAPELGVSEKTLQFSAAPGDDTADFVERESGELIRIDIYSWTENRYIEHENKLVEMNDGATEVACGLRVPTTVDWKSFVPILPSLMPDKYGVADICDDMSQRIAYACREGRTAQVKKARMKSITCRYQPKAKSKLTMKGGKVTLATSFDTDSYAPVDGFLVKKKILKKRPPMRKFSREEVARLLRVDPKTRCRQRCQNTCRQVGSINKCRQACVNKCR
ncbi:MAG: hypothetical protein AAF654_08785 [Myxococcota bacterium]